MIKKLLSILFLSTLIISSNASANDIDPCTLQDAIGQNDLKKIDEIISQIPNFDVNKKYCIGTLLNTSIALGSTTTTEHILKMGATITHYDVFSSIWEKLETPELAIRKYGTSKGYELGSQLDVLVRYGADVSKHCGLIRVAYQSAVLYQGDQPLVSRKELNRRAALIEQKLYDYGYANNNNGLECATEDFLSFQRFPYERVVSEFGKKGVNKEMLNTLTYDANIARSVLSNFIHFGNMYYPRDTYKIIEFFLKNGADPNIKDGFLDFNPSTPLKSAHCENRKDLERLLIKYGAKE
jgi:hypothetical protein